MCSTTEPSASSASSRFMIRVSALTVERSPAPQFHSRPRWYQGIHDVQLARLGDRQQHRGKAPLVHPDLGADAAFRQHALQELPTRPSGPHSSGGMSNPEPAGRVPDQRLHTLTPPRHRQAAGPEPLPRKADDIQAATHRRG